MSGFVQRANLQPLLPAELAAQGLDHQFYELTADLPYASELLARTVVAPSGLLTDFASIPRVVWGWIDPEDPAILYPSIIHDYLYSVSGKIAGGDITREQADETLREAMEFCGANAFQRETVFEAVRLGGGSHWK